MTVAGTQPLTAASCTSEYQTICLTPRGQRCSALGHQQAKKQHKTFPLPALVAVLWYALQPSVSPYLLVRSRCLIHVTMLRWRQIDTSWVCRGCPGCPSSLSPAAAETKHWPQPWLAQRNIHPSSSAAQPEMANCITQKATTCMLHAKCCTPLHMSAHTLPAFPTHRQKENRRGRPFGLDQLHICSWRPIYHSCTEMLLHETQPETVETWGQT